MSLIIISLISIYLIIGGYLFNKYRHVISIKGSICIGLSWGLVCFVQAYSFITNKIFKMEIELRCIDYNSHQSLIPENISEDDEKLLQ